MTPRLKEIFNKEIKPALKDQFGFKNIYMAPKIEKIVLNMGLGLDASDAKILKSLILGRAILTNLSKNSYILFFLSVTFKPALDPFLVLKLATDFLNFVITGFWPAIFAKSSSHDFNNFESFPSNPRPIFNIIFSIFGPI